MLVFEVMPVGRRLAGNAPALIDDVVRLAEARQFLARRPDQHGVHEQRVVGREQMTRTLMRYLRVPAGEAVEQ